MSTRISIAWRLSVSLEGRTTTRRKIAYAMHASTTSATMFWRNVTSTHSAPSSGMEMMA